MHVTDLYIVTHKHRHNCGIIYYIYICVYNIIHLDRNSYLTEVGDPWRPHFRRLINKNWEFEQIMGNGSLLEKHEEIQTVRSKVQTLSVKFGSSDVNSLTQPKSDHFLILIWTD